MHADTNKMGIRSMKKRRAIWVINEQNKLKNDISSAIQFWYGILEGLGYEVAYYPYENYNIDELYHSAKAFQPNLVLFGAYTTLHTEVVRLREFTKVFVVQSDDDWRFDDYARFWIPFVDGTVSFAENEESYKQAGATPDGFIKAKWAFNPKTMLFQSLDFDEKDILVSHIGGLHGGRESKLKELYQRGIQTSIIETNTKYTLVKGVWARSKFSLCFTMNSVNTGRQVKGKVSEIPAHAVLLSEPFPTIDDYFVGDEFVLFEDIDELVEKINRYSIDKAEYEKIYNNGRRWAWKNTTYHVWNEMLVKMDPTYEKVDVDKMVKEKYKDHYYE